jgi:hypothetical protein
MPASQSSREAIDREFLPTRAKILEIAATLDRVSRAGDESVDDPRWSRLLEAMKLVLERDRDRVERVQLLFSRAYDENWRETLHVK